jgi:hypothetical protein
MYKSDASYVSCRAGIYYYTGRVPFDVRQHYTSNRLSFNLRTKSNGVSAKRIHAGCPIPKRRTVSGRKNQ